MEGMEQVVVALDTETTGLDPEADEVLELAIVDAQTGEELLCRRYGTERTREWPEAEAVNHIAPADVEGMPTLKAEAREAREILKEADLVVAYNATFDMAFLEAAGVVAEGDGMAVCDAMLDFAEQYGEWDEERGAYRWQRLAKAAEHVGHVWEGDAHTAEADARATATVWRWLVGREAASVREGVPW